jgi:hypothetical protein
MPLEMAQSGIRHFLPLPIMQDFREPDKTYIMGDVLACRKAVDVLWRAAEIGVHRLIPKQFQHAQTCSALGVLQAFYPLTGERAGV